MSDALTPNQEGLTSDIDSRLMPLFEQLWAAEAFVKELAVEDVRDILGTVLRTAYIMGYEEALREDRAGLRSLLHKQHGFGSL